MTLIKTFLILIYTLAILGCTHTMYSDPEQSTQNLDVYTFRIAVNIVGEFQDSRIQDNFLKKYVGPFMKEHNYKSYTILSKKYQEFPLTEFIYVIKFSHTKMKGFIATK